MSAKFRRVHWDIMGSPICGQESRNEIQLTAEAAEVTCVKCSALMTGTSYSSGWRKEDREPCGTLAAARWHYRNGEKPTEACGCKGAMRRDTDRREQKKKRLSQSV
jgi:hypothetical protein